MALSPYYVHKPLKIFTHVWCIASGSRIHLTLSPPPLPSSRDASPQCEGGTDQRDSNDGVIWQTESGRGQESQHLLLHLLLPLWRDEEEAGGGRECPVEGNTTVVTGLDHCSGRHYSGPLDKEVP